MAILILLRHGQSTWNKENKFTGWVDVELSERGIAEAHEAAIKLASSDFTIDVVFTSVLKRAINTATIVATELKIDTKFIQDEALNERHYGDLQGMNKDEMRVKFGSEQVHIWRRSFDIRPPNGESLKDTCERVVPYYLENIKPLLKSGKNVLVVAHGNSLRGLIKELEMISEQDIVSVEVPTGVPIVYGLDKQGAMLTKEIL